MFDVIFGVSLSSVRQPTVFFSINYFSVMIGESERMMTLIKLFLNFINVITGDGIDSHEGKQKFCKLCSTVSSN
jgi:hypothetical protein